MIFNDEMFNTGFIPSWLNALMFIMAFIIGFAGIAYGIAERVWG